MRVQYTLCVCVCTRECVHFNVYYVVVFSTRTAVRTRDARVNIFLNVRLVRKI